MKYMIASDIHGSAHFCALLMDAFAREGAQRLVLLGDLLYHGPRNPLPREYDPPRVIELLNGVAERVLCVRGNCDSEVDQMVLRFPILADYAVLDVGGCLIYASHGHVYSADALPPLRCGDLFLQGHTHLPMCEERGGVLCLNPGSVSLPKEDSWHGYMVLEDGLLLWKDLEGREHMRHTLRRLYDQR